MLYAYRLVLLEMSILKEHCQKQQRQQPSIRVGMWTIMIDVNQKKVPQSFLECPFIFHIHNHKKGIKSAIILILKKKCKKNEQLTAFLWFFFLKFILFSVSIESYFRFLFRKFSFFIKASIISSKWNEWRNLQNFLWIINVFGRVSAAIWLQESDI